MHENGLAVTGHSGNHWPNNRNIIQNWTVHSTALSLAEQNVLSAGWLVGWLLSTRHQGNAAA